MDENTEVSKNKITEENKQERNIPASEEAAVNNEAPVKKKRRTGRRVAGVALLICFCIIISSLSGGLSAYVVCSMMPLFNPVSDGTADNTTSASYTNTLEPTADVSTEEITAPETLNTTAEQTEALTAEPTTQQPTIPPTEPPTEPPMLSASKIYSENVNSVVGISAYSTRRVELLFGVYTTKEVVSNGSGFLISSEGYVITNNHVVAGAHTYKVSMYDGSVYDATLAGSDPSNDMAVLKIAGGAFTPVELGESSEVAVGDSVLIVGNALGELSFSLTSGVVSFLNRSVNVDSHTMYMHQTDAAINVGNSGGPVFDMYGHVIGIASAKMSSESIEGLGFFIPIDAVKTKIIEIIA